MSATTDEFTAMVTEVVALAVELELWVPLELHALTRDKQTTITPTKTPDFVVFLFGRVRP
jgi:hypothetical protein